MELAETTWRNAAQCGRSAVHQVGSGNVGEASTVHLATLNSALNLRTVLSCDLWCHRIWTGFLVPHLTCVIAQPGAHFTIEGFSAREDQTSVKLECVGSSFVAVMEVSSNKFLTKASCNGHNMLGACCMCIFRISGEGQLERTQRYSSCLAIAIERTRSFQIWFKPKLCSYWSIKSLDCVKQNGGWLEISTCIDLERRNHWLVGIPCMKKPRIAKLTVPDTNCPKAMK